MAMSSRIIPFLIVSVLLLGAGVTAMRLILPTESPNGDNMTVPKLSTMAARGKSAFDANCATCHGANATGTQKGPPFVHDIYNPGHHSDQAFYLAAKHGVRRHHWPFGDMPPQPQVTDEELTAIVRYVRELQEANGIFYRPHTM